MELSQVDVDYIVVDVKLYNLPNFDVSVTLAHIAIGVKLSQIDVHVNESHLDVGVKLSDIGGGVMPPRWLTLNWRFTLLTYL